MATLSLHDRAVLTAIFNPNLPVSEAYDEVVEELKDEVSPSMSEEARYKHAVAKRKQMMAIELVENERNNLAALTLLDEAITLVSDLPSLYNDRGQILQFLGRFDDAFNDLSRAVRLADDRGDQKRSLCAALCQRGVIHRKFNRLEMAREDFKRAAEMGSKFAKSQLVEINPYAALCNQMLSQVMRDLQ